MRISDWSSDVCSSDLCPDGLGQLRCPGRGDGEDRLILIGLDPGLGCTGWGVIAAEGNRLSHVANGQIRTDAKAELAVRLVDLHDRLAVLLAAYRPVGAAVEGGPDAAFPHLSLPSPLVSQPGRAARPG